MAHAKETPRQKLIGMMYLVLTAMLALNVSKQVLEGYTTVNDAVTSTNTTFDSKRKASLEEFEKELTLNKIEVGPFWDKAKVAMKLSSEMTTYITNLRDELIATTEKVPIEVARKLTLAELKKKDNYTVPTHFLIGIVEDGSKGKARELKNKISAYREKMINLVNPKNRKSMNIGLNTEDKYKDAFGKKQSWEFHNFFDIPLAADIPILNKLISEVNNAELEVVDGLLRESIAEDFKYDRIEAKVLPKSNYLFTGEDFEAEVIVAAYDTSHSPSPTVYLMRGVDSLSSQQKDQAIQVARDQGHLNIKFPATSVGLQKYAGYVSVPTASGKERTYHFKGEYVVSQPSLTVSATNMNVLYIGVDNPLSISVAGIPKENIFPSISCGSLKVDKKTGGWAAVVPSGYKEAVVTISIKTDKGMKKMGSETFRVKKLPDPSPTISGKKEGFESKDNLIEAGKIVPMMPADFEFNYSFQVQSFRLTLQRGFNTYNFDAKNGNLTDEMIDQIRKSNRGQVLLFEDIVINGPNNDKRNLPPFFITVR
ncbi:MAG TPA: gliding motility protein GldM [Bacteroidales bacterium]|nr:gliding motility protein GldM [Bacteroidales bacterium]